MREERRVFWACSSVNMWTAHEGAAWSTTTQSACSVASKSSHLHSSDFVAHHPLHLVVTEQNMLTVIVFYLLYGLIGRVTEK